MKAVLVGAALLALLLTPHLGHTELASPRATLTTFIEQAAGILRAAPDPREAWSDLYQLTFRLFDGRAAARRTLGAEWERRSAEERADLSGVVTGVLARAYLELARSRLPRETLSAMRVLGEDVTGDGTATVRTSVRARDGSNLKLDYLMDRGTGRWRVYDVVVDGISVVENYRAQFARLVRTASYADAVAALRRVAGVDSAEAAPSSDVVTYFATGETVIGPDARAGLDRLAAWLGSHARSKVLVESHADARGEARRNDALAERRAAVVRQYLVDRGVAPAQIETTVHGARRPVCREASEACWAQNRRVVTRLD